MAQSPVQQDMSEGTNSSKTRHDNKMALLIQKIYYEHLGLCFDLSPVWHQPCGVMSLALSLYDSIFTLQKEISRTHTLTRTGPALTDATSPQGLFVQKGLICTTVSTSVFVRSKICPCHSAVCEMSALAFRLAGRRRKRQTVQFATKCAQRKASLRYRQRWSSGELRRPSGSPQALTDGHATCFPSPHTMKPAH